MTEQTIEQLRDELETRSHYWFKKTLALEKQEAELAQELMQACDELAHAKIRARKFETALADTRAARDILKRSRDFWRETCRAAEAERDQIRKEAQEQSDLVQRDWLSPCQKAGLEALVKTLRRQLTDADTAMDAVQSLWLSPAETRRQNAALARAREELAAVNKSLGEFHCPVRDPETDEFCGSFYKDHGVHLMRGALDEVRKEAEGLRRQLAKIKVERDHLLEEADALQLRLYQSAEGEAAIVEAVGAYLAQRKRRHLVMDEDCQNLQAVLEYRSDAAAKLLERLATLDAAEKALAGCGIGGIYNTFDDLEDAITQMADHIKELLGQQVNRELAERAQRQVAETSERASRKMLARQCDMARTAETEAMKARRELAEAEQRAEHAKAELEQVRDWLTIQKQGRDGDRDKLLGRTAMLDTVEAALQAERQLRREEEQRATRAEALAATLAEAHAMLNCGPQTPWSGCRAQEYCNEAHYYGHARAARELLEKALEGEMPTNTQALAALVTEELAAMLERLAGVVAGQSYHRTADRACALAAQIREALEDNKT